MLRAIGPLTFLIELCDRLIAAAGAGSVPDALRAELDLAIVTVDSLRTEWGVCFILAAASALLAQPHGHADPDGLHVRDQAIAQLNIVRALAR